MIWVCCSSLGPRAFIVRGISRIQERFTGSWPNGSLKILQLALQLFCYLHWGHCTASTPLYCINSTVLHQLHCTQSLLCDAHCSKNWMQNADAKCGSLTGRCASSISTRLTTVLQCIIVLCSELCIVTS